MVRIKKIGVLQTAKLAAILYFIFSAIIVVPIGLITMITGSALGSDNIISGSLFGGTFMVIMPIFYAVLGFIFVAIACLIYNLVAGFVGGIEIELENMDFSYPANE
ncbi:MAG: hypothetical protein GX846_10090 [Deltaproteobacteria bacterium]|jgi:hypothetical protein|nr:hypothetical protein [Deltaproteobacteria bacterium]